MDVSRVRASIEHSISMIANGEATYDQVVAHALDIFKRKFLYYVANVRAFAAHSLVAYSVDYCLTRTMEWFLIDFADGSTI